MNKINEIYLDTNKYGKQLLIDCHSYIEVDIAKIEKANYNKYYTSNFYEIHLIKTGKINLYIENQRILLKQNTILFLTPQKIRQWEIIGEITGKILIFESDFIESFFNDSFFLYRLQYFQNSETLPYINLLSKETHYYNLFFNEIEKEIIAYENDSQHLIRATLYYLLVKLNRNYSKFYNIKDNFLIFKYINSQLFKTC